mgnify:CR=1 FL=1
MKEIIIQNVHSISGISVFIIGLLQIILKKGGRKHKILGQIYLYTWLILLISGISLGGAFLSTVGIFGFYFVLTGSRIAKFKNKSITIFDKTIISSAILTALYMLYFSCTLYLKDQISFAIIFFVFGSIFLYTTTQDFFKYVLNKPLTKQTYGKLDWYFEHFIRMYISFIAALTAFASVQNVFNNNTLNFLLPTVIGTLFINFATKNYKKKLLKNSTQ